MVSRRESKRKSWSWREEGAEAMKRHGCGGFGETGVAVKDARGIGDGEVVRVC